MGIRHSFFDGMLKFVTVGSVEFAEGLAVLHAGLEEARHRAKDAPDGWGVLFDVRESTEDRSSNDMRGIAAELGKYADVLSKRAAILVSRPVYYGMGRMFGAFTEQFGIQVRVFYHEPDAVLWLADPKSPLSNTPQG